MAGGNKRTAFEIKEKLRYQEFETSLHAFEEAVDDFLSLEEVIKAVLENGEVIEDNPDDFRCLWCIAKANNSMYTSLLIIMT
jgi:hypothetical protein